MWLGSNPQPPDDESDALTTVPRCPTIGKGKGELTRNCEIGKKKGELTRNFKIRKIKGESYSYDFFINSHLFVILFCKFLHSCLIIEGG